MTLTRGKVRCHPVQLENFEGTEHEKQGFNKLQTKYKELLSRDDMAVGFTDRVSHTIRLTDETPVKQP